MVFKICVVLVAAALLAACGAPKPRERTPQGAGPPAAGAGANAGQTSGAGASGGQISGGAGASGGQAPGAGATPANTPATGGEVGGAADAIPPPAGPDVYLIDPAQSAIRLLVYRAGPMARLGHNHVITHDAVGGWIRFTGDSAAASFVLKLPVADFVVDNPGARAEEGSDFFEEVTQDAKDGTRHNMLSAALLDAEHYPTITLTSMSVSEHAGTLNATMTLRIAGHESTLVVPFQVATATGQISVSGIVTLRQTTLGLKPFSILMGALQVQDELTVKFTLFATTVNSRSY